MPSRNELPLPGPGERLGADEFMRRYQRSSARVWLNPLQAVQALRQAAGEKAAAARWHDNPPSVDTFEQKTMYTLPFEGEWHVFNGGTDEARSHSWGLLGQRYAYDFVIADAEGRRHRDEGTRLEDYFAYGAPVIAPADGEVVRVVDGVRDAPRVGTGWVDWLARDFTGNSVTIRHSEHEFSFLAHLARGTIAVKAGWEVPRGMLLAQCGNAGHSTEPHLHFQIQDRASFFGATSLPIKFSDCVVNGAPASEPTYLERGSRVRPRITRYPDRPRGANVRPGDRNR